MGSGAGLAAAFGTPKADGPAELRPVDRVKPPEGCSDWHCCEYHTHISFRSAPTVSRDVEFIEAVRSATLRPT
jgi:hypothetical protein